MKFRSWPRRIAQGVGAIGLAIVKAITIAVSVLLAPIGFREVLLFGGAFLLSIGLGMIYPPATYIAPGVVLVAVAVFGVRA